FGPVGTAPAVPPLPGRAGDLHLGQFVEHVPAIARESARYARCGDSVDLGARVAGCDDILDAPVRAVRSYWPGAADHRRLVYVRPLLSGSRHQRQVSDASLAAFRLLRPVPRGYRGCRARPGRRHGSARSRRYRLWLVQPGDGPDAASRILPVWPAVAVRRS